MPPPTPVDPGLFQYALTGPYWIGGGPAGRNELTHLKRSLCSGIQLSKELIQNSDGGRRWNGLIDRSVTRICWGQGPKGGGWVSLTLFGQGGGRSMERGVKHKLTDLSNRSPVRWAGTKKSWLRLTRIHSKQISHILTVLCRYVKIPKWTMDMQDL